MNIEQLFAVAKEVILECGEYVPTLFIEYEQSSDLVMAPIIGFGSDSQTTFDKQKMLFSIGRTLSKQHECLPLAQVSLVTEAWTSEMPKGEERKYDRPSDDPSRREVLIVSVLDVSHLPDLKGSLYLAEMIRDGSGKLIDLLSEREPVEVNSNKLLEAFFAGSLSAKMSDKKLKRLIKKYTR